jgi:hypothetical protein
MDYLLSRENQSAEAFKSLGRMVDLVASLKSLVAFRL